MKRRCTICRKLKMPLWFYANRSKRNGLSTECRLCTKKKLQEWATKNPAAARESKNRWQALNPDKRWHKAHPEKCRAALRRRYLLNRKKHLDQCREYYRSPEGIITSMLSGMRGNSRARGHSAPEIADRFVLKKWLFKRGFMKLHSVWTQSGYQKTLRPSIDRLDNSKGYLLSNIRLTTWEQNHRAAYQSDDHKKRAIENLRRYWKSKLLIAEYVRRKG